MPDRTDPTREPRLVLRAQLGDRRALDDLLRETQGWLFAYLRRLTGDEHRAEDLLQDCLLQVVRKLKHLREPRAYRAWVYRLASRRASRAFGARRLRAGPLDERDHAAFNPERVGEDERRALKRGISRLPANTRAIVGLHYGEGMSIARTASVLGVPEGTVKSRLASALRALREGLDAEGSR